MPRYSYSLDGTGKNGTTWFTEGTIEAAPGGFPGVVEAAMSESFERLTNGTARYGDPSTCTGPYTIRRLTVIREGN